MMTSDLIEEDLSLRLRKAFSAFPTGVVAVYAVGEDGRRVGMAVNSFTSISLDPPLVAISVANTSRTWPALARAGVIGLSVLGNGHEEVSRRLAARDGDRFEGGHWRTGDDGAVHLDDAALWLTCRVHGDVAGGDHTIVLLAVDDVRFFPETEPLVFHHSRYRSIGA